MGPADPTSVRERAPVGTEAPERHRLIDLRAPESWPIVVGTADEILDEVIHVGWDPDFAEARRGTRRMSRQRPE